jgi:hypothetical protein
MASALEFFVPEIGRLAEDELCTCGHPRSEHDDVYAAWEGTAAAVPGRGCCCADGCGCRKFKWADWIFSDAAPGSSRSRTRFQWQLEASP